MSSLPLEIDERIIDILAEDAYERRIGIRACSLVCRTFLPLCRKYIFDSVFLFPSSRRIPLEQILSQSPEIADYIRKLRYNIAAEDLTDPLIHQCLKRISKLRSLSIWGYERQLDWSSNDLRPVFLRLLHLPTLTSFRIGNFDKFIASDLTPCVNLKTLHIDHNTTGATTNTVSEILPDRSIQLNEFIVGYQAKAVMDICAAQRPDGQPVIDFSSVTKIKLDLDKNVDVEVSHELFRHCKRLTHVHISFWHPRGILPSIFKMLQPFMQTLTDLYIGTFVNGLDLDPLAGIPSELEAMRNENIIENIAISVVVPSNGCRQSDDWCGLDEVLTRSGWIALKEVSLNVKNLHGWRGDELDIFLLTLPRTQFPRLSKSESVSFNFKRTNQIG